MYRKFPIVIASLLFLAFSLLVAGCGGGQLHPSAFGSATITVEWPERGGRFIPVEADSIVIRLFQDGVELPELEATITRPDNSALIENIPVGLTTFTGSAYVSGNPDRLASGAAQAEILSGETAEVDLVLENGRIAFVSNRDGNSEIYVMDPDGTNQSNLTNHPASDGHPCWSPDGSKIAFTSNRSAYTEIYVMNSDGSNQTRLTILMGPASDSSPSWSPDGSKIAFSSDRDGNSEIYVMNSDGTDQINLTNTEMGEETSPSWSPDGSKIAFDYYFDISGGIRVMNSDGTNQAGIYSYEGFVGGVPRWSPDGTKIAFHSVEGGDDDIWLMNSDGTGAVNLTLHPFDQPHDGNPCWSPHGDRIAFGSTRDGNWEIHVIDPDWTPPPMPDGDGQVNLTNNPDIDDDPDWGAAPAAPPVEVGSANVNVR